MIYHGEILSEWVKRHKGSVARIGTTGGSGFVFAGRVDAFTLHHIEEYTGKQMAWRAVKEEYDSVFGGYLLLIEGNEDGKLECAEDEPPHACIPIENYQRIADVICAAYAELYHDSLIKERRSDQTKSINYASADIYVCTKFFQSDQFAILMPGADGDEVMSLIEKRVRREIGDD